MGCPMQTFNNITDPVWQCLRAKAAAAGIQVNSNTGSAGKFGVQVAWTYDPAAHTLQLQAVKHGIFGCNTINNAMHQMISECYASNDAAMGVILDH